MRAGTLAGAVLVFLALGLAGPARAQVNVEALRHDTTGQGLTGTLGADLALRTGNVQLLDLGIRGRIDYGSGRLATFLVGEGTLGLLKGRQFTSTGLVHFRQTYAWRPRLAPEWFAQVNYDKPRRLDFRALAGSGLRLRLYQSSQVRFWAGSGFMLEYERLTLPPGAEHPRETTVVRSSTYASLRAAGGDRFVLTSTTYIQPQVSDPGDLRILENFAVAAGITEEVALRVQFGLRYDSRPPDDITGLDTALLSGVTVRF